MWIEIIPTTIFVYGREVRYIVTVTEKKVGKSDDGGKESG